METLQPVSSLYFKSKRITEHLIFLYMIAVKCLIFREADNIIPSALYKNELLFPELIVKA